MKTKEEIEELVLEKFKHKMYNPFYNVAFVDGYTQCQEHTQKDVEYWKGEFDHWHQQAMEMADKYNQLLNKQ